MQNGTIGLVTRVSRTDSEKKKHVKFHNTQISRLPLINNEDMSQLCGKLLTNFRGDHLQINRTEISRQLHETQLPDETREKRACGLLFLLLTLEDHSSVYRALNSLTFSVSFPSSGLQATSILPCTWVFHSKRLSVPNAGNAL
jgi:hypothetical protein